MTFLWKPLKIGAGGQLTGLDYADDGSLVTRNDTYGAWIWNAASSIWTQILTQTSMPSADRGIAVTDTFVLGVFEIRFAPSNSNRMYMAFNGYLYISSDKGVTWARCAGWSHVSDSSGSTNAKFLGPFIAVDPQNPDVLIVATSDGSVFYSSDAGVTCTAISGIAVPTTGGGTLQQGGGYLIAFDRSSTVSGGKTQGVYISSYGTGVYHSTNGGNGTYTLTTSTPTTHRHMVIGSTGVVWHTDNSASGTGNLRKYTGSWSSAFAVDHGGSDNRCHSVSIDPADPTHIVVGMDWGGLRVTANSGTTWSGTQFADTRAATDIPYLAWTNESYMTNGDQRFDPSGSNKLGFAEGIGFWTTTPASNGDNTTWTSQSNGIEQLVGNRVLAPPGGGIVTAGWDRPTFYRTKSQLDIYPSTHGPDRATPILHCWALDYASSDPTFVCGIMFGGTSAVDKTGYSTDGGQTWTSFANQTPTAGSNGGSIAASTPTNIIYGSSNGAAPYYTTNGGTSWTQTAPGGITTGWGIVSYLFNAQYISADRVTANTFLMYNSGSAGPGVYKSIDGGANWSKVFTGHLAASDGGRESIRHVPGNAGHAYYTAGSIGGSNPGNTQFMKTTDQGTTWTAVPNLLEVYNFGFGKAKPGGGGYPTIFILGYVSNVFGIWRSDDGEQATPTWTQVSDGFPLGSFDFIKWVEGDPDVYNRCFVAFNGSGFAYGYDAQRLMFAGALQFRLHS